MAFARVLLGSHRGKQSLKPFREVRKLTSKVHLGNPLLAQGVFVSRLVINTGEQPLKVLTLATPPVAQPG